jgi:hypothetical protein
MPAINQKWVKVKVFKILVISVITVIMLETTVSALGINNRSVVLGNANPNFTTSYTFKFTIVNTDTIGSLSLNFCANDPIQGDPCDIPGGLDLSNATLTNQQGITDFTLFVESPTALILNRTPSLINSNTTLSFTLNNVVNPNAIGQFFVRLAAYSQQNSIGASIAYGGLAFAINSSVQISSVVPPYITLCTGITISNYNCNSAIGDYIDFGILSASHSSQGQSQILVATNSPTGYVMQVYGTTLTSGNNIINANSTLAPSKPGSQQFGINLRANSNPSVGADPIGPGLGQPIGSYNIPNYFLFNSQDVIAESSNPDNFRLYTVSYLVNVDSSQPPGIYVSTLTYVGSGTF